MDILKQLNNTVIYIENNLCGEIDTDKIAEIALCPYDKFKRFFSYMTNMSVSEYVRKRRLSLAAYELLNNKVKIIELAIKYGYNSADSFTRAFAKQHGVLPTEVSADTSLKVYPPVSFYIAIKGANELNFRIVNTDEIKLKGISRQFTGLAADRFEQEHIMWSNQHGDVQNQVCTTVEGVWYGIWDNGVYSIAKKANEIDNPNLESIKIPAGNMQYSQPTLAVLPAMFFQNSEREYLIVGFPILDMKRLKITNWKFTTFIPKTKRINGIMKFGYQLNS